MGDEAGSLRVLDADRRALTVGLVLVITMVAFEALAVATALPKTVDELGGVSLYGWAFSAFMLANLVGIAVSGHQADTRGPAPPLLAGLVLFAAGLVICGAAPSMTVVVVGRAVQGLGAGAVPAVAYVAIGRGYPEALRPRMFAVMSTAWVVPGIIGPGVAGFVAEHLSWRLVFLGLLPLLPLGGGLLIPALRRLGPTTASSASTTGTAVRLAAGAGLLLGGLGLHSLVGLPLVAAGVLVGFPALVRLLPSGALRAAPGLPAAVTMRSLQTFSFFGAEAFLPLMLTSVRGQSTTVAGLALTAATLSWTTGAWVQARVATRRSLRSVAVAGLVLVAAGVGLIATVLLDGVPVAMAAVGWAVAGLGMGLSYSMASVVVLAEAPADGVGAASAGLQLADVLGVALGTGLGGAIVAAGESGPWSRRTSIAAIDCLMVAVALLGALVATRLPRRTAAGSDENAER